MSEKTRTRLTAYITAVYGTEVLEQIKNKTKIVIFNGEPIEYNEKFRDKRVTEGTKIEVMDPAKPIQLDGNKDQPISDTDIAFGQDEEIGESLIESETKEENMAVVLKEDGSKRFPTPVGSMYLDENLGRKQTRRTDDMIIPDDAKAGEYDGSNKSNKANIEISPVPKPIPIDQESFDSKLKEAKAIIEMNNAGLDIITIASRVRIAESRVTEIIKLGIDEAENQLRRWYEVPKDKVKTEPKTNKPKKSDVTKEKVQEPVTLEPADSNAEVATGKTRIKGGVKLAEEAIVALLKEKPMTPKDLKAAAIAGVNPSTWVIRISKLKGAGKIVLGADGLYTAV